MLFKQYKILRCFFKKKEKSDFYKENEKTFSKPNETYSTEVSFLVVYNLFGLLLH